MVGLRAAVVVVLAAAIAGATVLGARANQDAQAPILVLETMDGTIEIQIYPDDAPKSVAHILALVEKGFYRGLRIHWEEPGIVQFGDPQTRDMTKQSQWGRGGSGKSIGVAETSKRPFDRGTVGLAYQTGRAPTTADSQLFILRFPNPALVGKYAPIGRVISGLDVVDKLKKTDRIRNITIKGGVPD
jgi:cyclophilin family peptidyl-prolyl cis-trans isomerase